MGVQRLNPLQAELDTLESNMNRARVMYRQYFLGQEKLEPIRVREDVERTLREFDRRIINNTAVKFRLRMLKARWISLNQSWTRILKQIEDGVYKPHQKMAEHRERERLGALADQQRKNGTAPTKAKSSTANKSNSALDKLHDQYSGARSKTGEGDVSKERLAKVVRQQAAAIKKKYNCRTVEFRVVIEDGKTKLKAIPKK